MVVFTEWVAKYAAYILWYFYDAQRLWYVPPLVRVDIRSIDFYFVFGSVVNHCELLDLIYAVYDIDWS